MVMLDRKTKNIDAGVELLMDRKDECKNWVVISLITGAVSLIGGTFFISFLDDSFSLVFCFMGIGLLILGNYISNFVVGLNVLIQSRKIMDMQRNHTLLIDEILNCLDGSKKIVKKKRVKKT